MVVRFDFAARFIGTVKDFSQICRCLGGATGVIALHPALLLFEQRYVQVSSAAPLVFDDGGQPGGHQHQLGSPVGKRAEDAGPATDLPVQLLDGVVRSDSGPMLHGEVGVRELARSPEW
mgnify:FL=1